MTSFFFSRVDVSKTKSWKCLEFARKIIGGKQQTIRSNPKELYISSFYCNRILLSIFNICFRRYSVWLLDINYILPWRVPKRYQICPKILSRPRKVSDIVKICNNFMGEHPCRSAISIKLLNLQENTNDKVWFQ